MIIHVTLPLVAEHGAAVTTNQIAAAAGIGEATIFRVFSDKQELIDACVAEALRPDAVLDVIRSIPLERPLPARLHEAATALEAHLDRMSRVMGAMHASGHGERHRPARSGTGPRAAGPSRADSMAETRAAVAELFAPEEEHLRLPREQLAAVLLDVLFARRRRPSAEGEEPLCLASLIQLFLHGALSKAELPPVDTAGGEPRRTAQTGNG